MLLAATFAAYLVLATLIDSRALPHSGIVKRPLAASAISLCALTLLYALWFALSWRPIFSMNAALITLIILVLISNKKFIDVKEPLNFMDFALVPQVLRHPRLYRAEFLSHPFFWLGVLGLIGIILAWCLLIEVSLLLDEHRWKLLLGGFAATALVIAWLVKGPMPASLVAALNRQMLPIDSARDVSVFGLAGSLLAGLIAWRMRTVSPRSWPAVAPAEADAPLVVVVQSESFVDLVRAGVRDLPLPGLGDARSKSALQGCLSVPVQGAWTLRCEFEFLTGQPIRTFGLDALHPYLRLSEPPPRTLAQHLREAGFSTVFLHPFDIAFFNRDRALPKLGFERLIGEEDFRGVEREGYYIPDMAVADRFLELARTHPSPLFCMIATMENHNPWDRDRLPGIEGRPDQYVHHLRNADRMIARLISGIEANGRPAVVAFYGDHVPTMPELAFPNTLTDYFVAGFRDGAWIAGEKRDLALHELAGAILDVLERIRRS